MQKEIELTDKTVLVVGLPEGTKEFKLVNFPRAGLYLKQTDSKNLNGFDYKLPKGDWQLVGIHPELTEEECAMVVEGGFCSTNGMNLYECYLKEDEINTTAKEAFDTLMQKLECYTVNPYGNFECQNQWCENGYINQGYGDKWRCDFCQDNEDKLDEAEQATFPKWAVLIRKK